MRHALQKLKTDEVFENFEADGLTFFRVKLAGKDLVARYHGGKGLPIFGFRSNER